MKLKNLFCLCIIFGSCQQNSVRLRDINEQEIAKVYTLKQAKNTLVKNDTLFFNGKQYSGFAYQLYPNTNDTAFIEPYQNGLLQGIVKKWYANHQVLEERQYANGKKNGRQVSYWQNGITKFDFTAKNDAYEGELKEWTFDGKLIHLAHFVKGQEEGVQKLWYDNGKIRANYIMLKGKRYGLLGTKNCKNVSDSIFIVK